MTDLSPNDLSHLSDEEFNALCPQGEHAPGPEPLSPAAQAVDHAIAARIYLLGEIAPSKQVAAAALRALADQVVPERLLCTRTAEERTLYHEGRLDAAIRFRAEILAIATELEGQ